MSETIEVPQQTAEAEKAANALAVKARAAMVVERAELAAIRLHSFKGDHDVMPSLAVDGFDISVSAEAKTATRTQEETLAPVSLLLVLITFRITAKAQGANTNGAINLEIAYEMVYTLTSLDGLTKAHYSAYAEWISIYNVFPYLRNFVQELTGNMGFPPILLPLWKPKTDRPTSTTPDLAFLVSDRFEAKSNEGGSSEAPQP